MDQQNHPHDSNKQKIVIRALKNILTVNTTKHYMINSCSTMFAKTKRRYTIFTDSLCKSTKKKGIHKRNDAKSESPGTDPNFFFFYFSTHLTTLILTS